MQPRLYFQNNYCFQKIANLNSRLVEPSTSTLYYGLNSKMGLWGQQTKDLNKGIRPESAKKGESQ